MFRQPQSPTRQATADAESLLGRHPVHLIYKHSPYCGLSLIAERQVQRYQAAPDALPMTVIDVFEQRALSDAIETVTGVRHESPQILVVRDGRVHWHASHRRVTAEAIADAVADVPGG